MNILKLKNITMKSRTIILIIVFCTFFMSCSNKHKRFQPNATNDNIVTIIGRADTSTNIRIEEKNKTNRDTIKLESPGFNLWYTKELPEKYKDHGFLMWTESKVYGEDVSTINVFVTNPTNKKFWMGRDWSLRIWDGTQWCIPPIKSELNVFADALSKKEAPLLYCFRFPIGEYYYLQKGKYRISKSFLLQEKDEINLYAEFEIK